MNFSTTYKEDNASELNESKVECILNINIFDVQKLTFYIAQKRLNRYFCVQVFWGQTIGTQTPVRHVYLYVMHEKQRHANPKEGPPTQLTTHKRHGFHDKRYSTRIVCRRLTKCLLQ